MILRLSLLFSILSLAQFCSSHEDGSNLPGHMQPLGSHRPPIMIQRIWHLPTPAEFHKDYVTPKVPVVMEGALNGASVWKKWQNDEYLRELAGKEMVGVEEGKKENPSDPKFTISVGEFLDRYESEDIYMVNELPAPMYNEWELPRPLLCGGLLDNLLYTYMWFSSGGTNSVLHTDSFENFHCLVSGKKRFSMFEPHYNHTIGPEHEKKGFYDVNVEKFQESECPPDEELPEYLSLGTIELSPELMIVVALVKAADSDGSVRAERLHQLINEMESEVALEDIRQLFEHLQPGCEGVIRDHSSIPRANLKKAHAFMTVIWEGPGEGAERRGINDEPPNWPEGGGIPPSEMEGGGDGEVGDIHDEL